MRVLFILMVVAISSTQAMAQSDFIKKLMTIDKEVVVLKDIEPAVILPSSEHYYPKLYERYEKGDTTLTLQDYRHLYYGYMYNVDYRPHSESRYVDSLSNMLNSNGGSFVDTDIDRAITYIDSVLQERPFSMKFLNILVYLYDEKIRDEKRALEYSYKFNMLLSTIFSSGSGIALSSPWKVLYREDVQTILAVIGADVARRTHMTVNIEYYFLKEKLSGIKGFYFDLEAIYTRPAEPKGRRKLEVNPYNNHKSSKYRNPRRKTQ